MVELEEKINKVVLESEDYQQAMKKLHGLERKIFQDMLRESWRINHLDGWERFLYQKAYYNYKYFTVEVKDYLSRAYEEQIN